MKKELVIEILTNFNAWRKGQLEDYPIKPKELGRAIEYAVKYLKEKI